MTTHAIADRIDFSGDKPQSSYSALMLHRKCPQAWLYRYGMRLEPLADTPTPYLTLGRWWSVLRAVEVLQRGRAAESLRFVPRDLRDETEGYDLDPANAQTRDVLAASEVRWRSMGAEEREGFEGALGASLPDRLHHMLGVWDTANRDRFDRERPLGAEVFWKRELPRPEGDAAWGLLADPDAVPRMHLIGYIDELYLDRARNMVVIRDHKAPKDLGNVTSALDDLMDSQLMLYAWGIEPKLIREGLPLARAVEFDRTKSIAPKEPVLTATGTLSKSVTAYDLETYRRWASEDTRPSTEEVLALAAAAEESGKPLTDEQVQMILDLEPGRVWGKLGEFYASGSKKGQPKFGIYAPDPKVIEHLATEGEREKWTKRSLSPVNRRIVQAHMRSAIDTALDIYQTQQRAQVTGAAARNLDRRGCAWCDFADICQAQMIGGPRGEYDLEAYGLRQKPARREKEKAA